MCNIQLFDGVSVQEISHDTKKFRFRLPSESHILGLPVGTVLFRFVPTLNDFELFISVSVSVRYKLVRAQNIFEVKEV